MNRRCSPIFLVIVAFFSLGSIAHADAGLPMIAIYLPAAWLALVPIILIESFIGRKKFALPNRRATIAAGVANVVSTIVGIPLAWIAWATIEGAYFGGVIGTGIWRPVLSVTAQAAWLLPYEKDLYWMIPVASLVLTFVFYALSVVIEYAVVKPFFPEQPKKHLFAWMVRANLWSYAFIFLLACGCAHWQGICKVFQPVVLWFWGIAFYLARLLHGH